MDFIWGAFFVFIYSHAEDGRYRLGLGLWFWYVGVEDCGEVLFSGWVDDEAEFLGGVGAKVDFIEEAEDVCFWYFWFYI